MPIVPDVQDCVLIPGSLGMHTVPGIYDVVISNDLWRSRHRVSAAEASSSQPLAACIRP